MLFLVVGKIIIQPLVSCFYIYNVERIISFYVEVLILLVASNVEKVSSKQLK